MTASRRLCIFQAVPIYLLMAISVAQAQYSGGGGTADDPYQIGTAADLIALGETPDDYDKHFILTADIDLDPNLPGSRVFDRAVIAPDTDDTRHNLFQGTPFTGTLNGSGHAITHLTITGEDYLGLFGMLSAEAEVRDLRILDVNIVAAGEIAGALIASSSYQDLLNGRWTHPNRPKWPVSDGILSNCYSTGSVCGGETVGGLVGANEIDVSLCCSAVVVCGDDTVGGLIGENGAAVNLCSSTGAISGLDAIGGLVGINNGDVAGCHSSASVSGVTSISGVGGLVGLNRGTLTGCHSTGAVSGNSNIGGLVGNNESDITDCHSSGCVSGSWHVGGLVGDNSAMPSYNPYYWVGTVANSYSTGSVDCVERWGGGLIGFNDGSVRVCYSSSDINGNSEVGGLIGCNQGDVIRCHSAGRVTGVSEVGGLLGSSWETGTVRQCYSTGTVDGSARVGGLVGNGHKGISIINCFWDVEVSGLSESAGGTGRTTTQMQDIQTYLDAGWDFVDEVENGTSQIWQMPEGGGYPALAGFEGYTPPILDGLGTPDDPYLISDALELGAMAYYDPSAHYRLDASIDLSGIRWATPLIWRFGGTFDGSGHSIYKLTIESLTHTGLFGTLQTGAEVRDLKLVYVEVTGTSYVGGIAGSNQGTIDRCYSAGDIEGGSGYYPSQVGGLVGNNTRGTVANCVSAGTTAGRSGVGGLVGDNSAGTVSNCYSMSDISGRRVIGGLVGRNGGKISNSYSTGGVSGQEDTVGGLVGSGGGSVSASFWDKNSSGLSQSAAGIGLTTAEMQTAGTFLEAGWDFIDETENGTDDVWWILEGQDYPRLWWELEDEEVGQ